MPYTSLFPLDVELLLSKRAPPMFWSAISAFKLDFISFLSFEEAGSLHVSLRRSFALAGSISIVIGLLLFLGSAEGSRAQNLPSWAEPQNRPEQRRNESVVDEHSFDSEGNRGRRQSFGKTQHDEGPDMVGARAGTTGPIHIGEAMPLGATGEACDVSRDCPGYPNAYCAPDKGPNGKCFTNGSGPGNGEGGGQQPPDVPIKGWYWLAALGLGYGGYRLSR